MSTLGGAVGGADPGHFEFKIFVFAVLVCRIYDARGFFDSLFKRQITRWKIQFLEFGFGSLSTLSSGRSVISLGIIKSAPIEDH